MYTGEDLIDHKLRDELEGCVEGSLLEILKINNERKRDKIIAEGENTASLDDLQPVDVFKSLLQEEQVLEREHNDLIARFLEMAAHVAEEDLKRE